MDLTKFKGAGWAQRDDAWFVKAGVKGAPLSGPLKLQNGVLEFQIRLGEADRHSLRLHTAGNEHSYRVVLSRAFIDIAKNPSKGENADQTLPLGKSRVRFKTSEWLTVRLTFQNDELTVECAGTKTKAKHAVFAVEKAQVNFIAFEGDVGVRGVQVANFESGK